MSRVNIIKQIKIDGRWKLRSIPKTSKGTYDWAALPEGEYFIEWHAAGKRRRSPAGGTAAQALEAQRRKRHELEGHKLGTLTVQAATPIAKQPVCSQNSARPTESAVCVYARWSGLAVVQRSRGRSAAGFVAAIGVVFRTRTETSLEVLALRQQVAVLKRKRTRPRLSRIDRLFWTILRQV